MVWARRPLAAARAVIFAQMVNDPGYQQGGGFKYGVNKKEAAIVLVGEADAVEGPFYLQNPFDTEPGWGVSSVNYDLRELLARATHFTHSSK